MTIARDGGITAVRVPLQALIASYVQLLGENILLVGARCHWRASEVDKNALVVDFEGDEVTRFTLGDGIADLRVAPDQTIWASYFDERRVRKLRVGKPGPQADRRASTCLIFTIS